VGARCNRSIFWQQRSKVVRHCCHKRQQCQSNVRLCSIRQCRCDIVAAGSGRGFRDEFVIKRYTNLRLSFVLASRSLGEPVYRKPRSRSQKSGTRPWTLVRVSVLCFFSALTGLVGWRTYDPQKSRAICPERFSSGGRRLGGLNFAG